MTLIEKLKNIKSNNQYWFYELTKEELKELYLLTSYLPEDSTMTLRKIYLLNGFTGIQLCPVCGKPILKI
ncbi:hypothetical protein EOM09_08590, partial [bacterium]|nr:hypothetical protein [bacterium]